ncbi:MAG TPA: hypothetical protein VK449_08850, partial [Anaerolineales bacterium]|nr:hypothetical protein [Anaerolineales bacterium]
MESVPSIGDFWKILLLRDDALMTIRRSRGGFSLSLRLFLLAGLIASIGVLAGGLAQAGRTTTSDRLQAAAASVTQAASGPWMKYLPRLSAGLVALSDRLNGAATAVESVQPPLGSRTSQAIRAFGAWASQPFLSLAAWLAGILPFVLAARLLGGQGTLRQQVSLLLLAFLPQALL